MMCLLYCVFFQSPLLIKSATTGRTSQLQREVGGCIKGGRPLGCLRFVVVRRCGGAAAVVGG